MNSGIAGMADAQINKPFTCRSGTGKIAIAAKIWYNFRGTHSIRAFADAGDNFIIVRIIWQTLAPPVVLVTIPVSCREQTQPASVRRLVDVDTIALPVPSGAHLLKRPPGRRNAIRPLPSAQGRRRHADRRPALRPTDAVATSANLLVLALLGNDARRPSGSRHRAKTPTLSRRSASPAVAANDASALPVGRKVLRSRRVIADRAERLPYRGPKPRSRPAASARDQQSNRCGQPDAAAHATITSSGQQNGDRTPTSLRGSHWPPAGTPVLFTSRNRA